MSICGPRPELVEAAARTMFAALRMSAVAPSRRSPRAWADLTDVQRAAYRAVACDTLTEVLPLLTVADVPHLAANGEAAP